MWLTAYLLMKHGNSFSGFQLIQTEGQREASGKLFDATEG